MSVIAAFIRLALFIALSGACGGGTAAWARDTESRNAIASVTPAELPIEARQTLRLIRAGGPFPFPHNDGSVFGNFEKRLPAKARGYYREYTVPTPGRTDRGAGRIIAGQGKDGDVATSGEYYYTPDHYRSFRRIGSQ